MASVISGLKIKITDQNIYLKNPLQINKYYQKISKILKYTYLKNPLQKSNNIYEDIFAQIGLFASETAFFNRGHDMQSVLIR